MRLGHPSFKVHLRDVSSHPEITVATTAVVSVRHEVVTTAGPDGKTLDRALIYTIGPALIRTTETYEEVLRKIARS